MNAQDELTQRITEALEARPSIAAPAHFSAQLMAQLPQRRAQRIIPAMRKSSNYGRFVTLAMLAVMMLAMVCAALFVARSTAWTLAEDVLFVQFGALTLWFFLSRHRVS